MKATHPFHAGQRVRYHPIISREHDGRVYVIRELGHLSGGTHVAWLEGKSGCVSVRALSPIPVITYQSADAGHTLWTRPYSLHLYWGLTWWDTDPDFRSLYSHTLGYIGSWRARGLLRIHWHPGAEATAYHPW